MVVSAPKVLTSLGQIGKTWKSVSQVLKQEKIILSVESFFDKEHALEEALIFEELYLRAKLETEQLLSQADRDRLAKLKSRI